VVRGGSPDVGNWQDSDALIAIERVGSSVFSGRASNRREPARLTLFGHPRWWAVGDSNWWKASSFCSLPYHTQGTRRYLTLCIYSAYPCKSLRRKFSSSRIRQTSTGKNGTTRRTLHHEPSASGIAKSRSNAPDYIGCRTYAYGPVDTTGCPSSTLSRPSRNQTG